MSYPVGPDAKSWEPIIAIDNYQYVADKLRIAKCPPFKMYQDSSGTRYVTNVSRWSLQLKELIDNHDLSKA